MKASFHCTRWQNLCIRFQKNDVGTGRRKIHQLADRLRFQANIWNGNEQEFTDLLSHIKSSIDTAKEEGKNEKALEIAKNMLADGVDINLIKKYSGLTQEQIEKMK